MPATTRTIFHVDLDAFFVAVERVRDPSLNGKPVIIGGLGPRGVVATASYEARKFGVRSAQPMAIARRRCPQAVFMRGDHDLYREYSVNFRQVLDRYSPDVSAVSIDEAYMDMTGSDRLFGPPVKVAEEIRARISGELGITASIGIGPNKLVAKVATEDAKPDGVFMVAGGDEAAYFAPRPVRDMPGIGPKAAEALTTLGIERLGQLAEHPVGPLRRILGPNHALGIQERARGIDRSPVMERAKTKSISAETTFAEDVDDTAELATVMRRLSARVGARLRKAGLYARGVSIKLRYPDFTTVTRQVTLRAPADADAVFVEASKSLMDRTLAERAGPVRLLGVGLTGLGERAAQLSLLDHDGVRESAISSAMDRIRDRFGEGAVRRGS